jgi:serine/threonine protein kinase
MTDMQTPEPTVFLPRSIGAYHIEKELGSGAMGTVFQAVHTGLERAVALKVLRPDTLEDPDAIRRFLREARNIARLEHPYIVSVYDAGEADGMHYIAMKLLEGETLQSTLARTGPLPTERVVRIGMQLASALDYAHAQDVAHLDIKPANVMIASGDRTFLTDFSIAQALNPGATRSATISGTPLYMSPEQITGKDVDSRSDIYSLGLLLYEMCVGHPPFQGQFVTVMYAHLHTSVPDIRVAVPEIPQDLAAIIDRCLKKDPNERYQTAGDLLRALSKLAPSLEQDPAGTVAIDKSDQELRTAIAAQAAASTQVITREGVVPERVRAPRPWLRYGIPAAVVIAIAAVVAAIFLTRSTGASTGSIRISSVPPGASVALDGLPRGRAPLTLTKISTGVHRVLVSLPTYDSQSIPVNVSGDGTTTVNPVLQSWAPNNLIQVGESGLARRVTRVGSVLSVAPLPATLTEAQLRSTTIHAYANLSLKPAAQSVRNVQILTDYGIYAPDGAQVGLFPSRPISLTLDKTGSGQGFSSGVHLTPRGQFPTGRWTVRLLVNGQTLRTFSFAVTR